MSCFLVGPRANSAPEAAHAKALTSVKFPRDKMPNLKAPFCFNPHLLNRLDGRLPEEYLEYSTCCTDSLTNRRHHPFGGDLFHAQAGRQGVLAEEISDAPLLEQRPVCRPRSRVRRFS